MNLFCFNSNFNRAYKYFELFSCGLKFNMSVIDSHESTTLLTQCRYKNTVQMYKKNVTSRFVLCVFLCVRRPNINTYICVFI